MHKHSSKRSRMNRFLTRISLIVLSLALSAPAWGQITQVLPSSNDSRDKAAPNDPLGRQTPNGTLFGFLQAMQAGNFQTAAQYLQLSPARRATHGEQLAAELKEVLDSAFVGSLRAISTEPEGSVQAGFPSDRERLGTISVDDNEADVILVRVSDPGAGKIWLFSAETLAKVPELYDQLKAHQVETHVPSVLVKTHFL